MMDWQRILDNAVQAKRAEAMKTSPQLTVGEVILLLEAVQDKSKPVIFDDPAYHPVGIDSWRGSYCELALSYEQTGKPLTTTALLKMLKNAVGATFGGYKGGEFLMGKTTPIWVANYGESHGYQEHTQAVVGVSQHEQHVTIETQPMEY